MSSLVLTLKLEKSQTQTKLEVQKSSTKDKEELRGLQNLLNGIAAGRQRATIAVQTGSADPLAGTTGGTITLSSFADADTIRIGNVVLTGKSSPTTEDHFEIDGDDTADAAALAAAINAHSVLSQIISATSALGVVTVRSLIPGVISNQIYMAASAHATVVQLSGSTGGATEAAVTYNFGI